MEQVLYGLAVALPGIVIGILAYTRARKVDAVAEQSGVAIETRAGTTQVIEALNALIDNLQEDNKAFRDDLRYLTSRLDTVVAERNDLRHKLYRLYKKYGNGNGDFPNGSPIAKEKA